MGSIRSLAAVGLGAAAVLVFQALTPDPRPAHAVQRQDNQEVWWYGLDGDRMTAAWVSPRFQAETGQRFRLVNLFFHAPSMHDPFYLFAGPVMCDSSHRARVGAGDRYVSVAPAGGLTWDQVADRDDVVVTVQVTP